MHSKVNIFLPAKTHPFYSVLVCWSLKCRCSLLPSPDHFQFALIHGPNIPGSYAILLFTASDFTSITSYIHNWVLFLLWLHLFILSGVISPLISSSILGTYWPREFIFQCLIFLLLNAGLDEAQAGIKIARRNISNLRYADDPTLMAESEEELKNLLMKGKEESEKVGLKLNI